MYRALLFDLDGIASTQRRPETLEGAGAFMVAEDFTDPELRRLLER